MIFSASERIGTLLKIVEEPQESASFGVLRPTGFPESPQRLSIIDKSSFSKSEVNALWAIPNERCGDSPTQYHPKFLMAILSSLPAKVKNAQVVGLTEWQIPAIQFATEESTRRSMTLNGMRMSTEYFASGSPRIFQLVQQRLQANQSDVVHDILVYLMQRILELNSSFEEEQVQLSDSIAAYLGLNSTRIHELLATQLSNGLLSSFDLKSAPIVSEVKNGFAGVPRANVNVAALIENQAARFSGEVGRLQSQFAQVLQLVDEVVTQLYQSAQNDC